MDPRIVACLVLMTLVFPRSLTTARAQINDIKNSIPGISSLYPDLSCEHPAESRPGQFISQVEISSARDLTDSADGFKIFSSCESRGNISSMLLLMQDLLTPQEVLLEYFPSDTMICISVTTKESYGICTSRIDPGLWETANLFLRRLRLADFGDFRQLSEALSTVLLGPVAMALKGKSRAVIISHNTLYGFPFEALVYPVNSQASTTRRSMYLIECKEIVYNNSLEQWLTSRLRNRFRNGGEFTEPQLAFVGFSPGFRCHECVQMLNQADHEICTIGRMFMEKGKIPVILKDENSNENNFKCIARFTHILHIATHTVNSKGFPEMKGLLFHEFGSCKMSNTNDDGLLTVHEICELRLTADLIVLNACASANIGGRIGMNWFSFADCFMKAGAGNVLCTRWNVTDRLAEKFMVEFYRYYLSGMTFSKALQQVKIRMIAEQSLSLPVNWAAYVLLGD